MTGVRRITRNVSESRIAHDSINHCRSDGSHGGSNSFLGYSHGTAYICRSSIIVFVGEAVLPSITWYIHTLRFSIYNEGCICKSKLGILFRKAPYTFGHSRTSQ